MTLFAVPVGRTVDADQGRSTDRSNSAGNTNPSNFDSLAEWTKTNRPAITAATRPPLAAEETRIRPSKRQFRTCHLHPIHTALKHANSPRLSLIIGSFTQINRAPFRPCLCWS